MNPPHNFAGEISKRPIQSAKIQFQSRKIRKLTPNATAIAAVATKIGETSNDKSSTSTAVSIPTQIAKSLSCETEIERALTHLRRTDPLIAGLITGHQPPAFTPCSSPFLSLSRSILYQQLATNAAKAIYTRFITLLGDESKVVPDAVLALSAQQLRQIGVSGRKASYLHDLAGKFGAGVLSDSSILAMDDEELLRMLTAVKGIGAWSVHMFMIFSLHRPDVLPTGDLGVRKGVQRLYRLKQLPKPKEMEEICEKWRPFRTVGSWYMWRVMEAKSGGGGGGGGGSSGAELKEDEAAVF